MFTGPFSLILQPHGQDETKTVTGAPGDRRKINPKSILFSSKMSLLPLRFFRSNLRSILQIRQYSSHNGSQNEVRSFP